MISVIVPSRNSEKTIGKTIKSLLNQDYKGKYEIIVVDKSTDKTPEIVSRFPVKLIKQKSKGVSAARNLGVKKAKGKIVAFIDSDCIAPKNWLTNLLKLFSDKTVVAVGGTYKTKNIENDYAKATGILIKQRHERMKTLETIDFVGGFSCAYRKNVFLKSGGFDTSFAQSEDGELSYRISKKGKIKFNSSAYVYHYHPDTLKKFAKQAFWHAYWRILVYKKHKDKMRGDAYTPFRTVSGKALTGFIFLLFVLGLFHTLIFHDYKTFRNILFIDFFVFLFTLGVAYLTIRSYRKIRCRDKVKIASLMVFRDFVMFLGIIFGLVKYFIRSK